MCLSRTLTTVAVVCPGVVVTWLSVVLLLLRTGHSGFFLFHIFSFKQWEGEGEGGGLQGGYNQLYAFAKKRNAQQVDLYCSLAAWLVYTPVQSLCFIFGKYLIHFFCVVVFFSPFLPDALVWLLLPKSTKCLKHIMTIFFFLINKKKKEKKITKSQVVDTCMLN